MISLCRQSDVLLLLFLQSRLSRKKVEDCLQAGKRNTVEQHNASNTEIFTLRNGIKRGENLNDSQHVDNISNEIAKIR